MQTILGLVVAGLGGAVVPHCNSMLRGSGVHYLALDATGFGVKTPARWQTDTNAPALTALLAELPIVWIASPRRRYTG